MKNKIEKIKLYYRKNENIIIKRLLLLSIFVIFFILLLFQHNVIEMYFDDFGNASLSYGQESPNIKGTNFTFLQLINWDIMIYNTWGGRILYATLFLIPMLKNGIKLYMILQCIVIILLFYIFFKIVKKVTNHESAFIPLISMILYMMIDINYVRDGLYWASASVLYLWPLLPTFTFIYLYIKISEKIIKNEKIKYYLYLPIMMLLNFFATFSHEQIGISIIVFITLYSFIKYKKRIKIFLKLLIPNLITALVGYILLFAAPGNWVRLDSNVAFAKLSAFEKIKLNLPIIIKNIFADKLMIFMIILTFVFLATFIISYKEMNLKRKHCVIGSGIFLLITIICLALKKHFIYATIIYGIIWIIFIGMLMIYYFYKTNRLELISIPISGCSTIFCLVFSPVLGLRTSIPFMFFIFLLILIFIGDLLEKSNTLSKILILITIIPFLIYGITNYSKIYNGYMNNYGIEELNFKILSSYEENDGKVIKLYKSENPLYGYVRSYERPENDHWIKDYFDIPQDVVFDWIDIYEKVR